MKSLVLITGAAGGVGKAFSVECAARGWDLMLTDQPGSPLEALAEGMRRMYAVQVETLTCDLTDADARAAFWREIQHRGAKFWMLINVAGMEFEGPFQTRSLDKLRTITRLNVETVVEMTHAVLHHRNPAQTLCIINISSLSGFNPMPFKAVYAASKRFIINFSLALHKELREQNVSVTVVCPAAMPTSPRSIRGLNKLGGWGQLSLSNPNRVAAVSLKYALAGRPLYIPGIFNRAVRLFSHLLPYQWVTWWIWRHWRGTHTSE
jgi:short-subunit dehydrogenase